MQTALEKCAVGPEVVHIVDDDPIMQRLLSSKFSSTGRSFVAYSTAEEFLEAYDDESEQPRCLVLDFLLPGMSGLELQQELIKSDAIIPIVMTTGYGKVSIAVEALQAGAIGFLEKPFNSENILKSIASALAVDAHKRLARRDQASFFAIVKTLSPKEREVMDLMFEALNTKEIAARLEIGFQTAAKHHSHVLRKLGMKNDADFVGHLKAFGYGVGETKHSEPLSPASGS